MEPAVLFDGSKRFTKEGSVKSGAHPQRRRGAGRPAGRVYGSSSIRHYCARRGDGPQASGMKGKSAAARVSAALLSTWRNCGLVGEWVTVMQHRSHRGPIECLGYGLVGSVATVARLPGRRSSKNEAPRGDDPSFGLWDQARPRFRTYAQAGILSLSF